MWLKWLPWKFIIHKVARAQGFVDPIMLLSRFNRFAQPAEVLAPTELLRAGAVMHARGLINSQVIQHNLDWVWPYWAERQFEPIDRSFIPRAFSLTHINLTHRNWTAVGLPGFETMPVIDARGLLMPFFDSWSVDAWIIAADGRKVIPSKLGDALQRIEIDKGLRVVTESKDQDCSVMSSASVELRNGIPFCCMSVQGLSPVRGHLIISIRPYNMEGISFIHRIRLLPSLKGWEIDGKEVVWLSEKPDISRFANYKDGDVYHWALSEKPQNLTSIECDVGMATTFAGFKLSPDTSRQVKIEIPLLRNNASKREFFPVTSSAQLLWEESLKASVPVKFAVKNYGKLYDTALRTLILHTPLDSYAGPYTYKRFWFRDAAFIVYSLLIAGLHDRAKRVIERFFHRQESDGYFMSQEGEWDSNGQALWAMAMYCRFTAAPVPQNWLSAVKLAAAWIINKRADSGNGLFPAGFSAEHLGPNDHYYWDDFWGIAGLESAEFLLICAGEHPEARKLRHERLQFLRSIKKSLHAVSVNVIHHRAMPASPNRRLDSGSVGSLCAGYPLGIWPCANSRLLATARFLFDKCLINGAFYHDISHSGINPYLSLHIAQVLLGAGDSSFSVIMDAIANLATPAGQWPEAIHPQLQTGCMGDGQHTWAAAEWISMVRNCFIREEGENLFLCGGILPEYLKNNKELSFGPAPTLFGNINVQINKNKENKIQVRWKARWHGKEPNLQIAFPGKEKVKVSGDKGQWSE
ncbi:MAG: hypothetical protein LBI42_07110 [Chitinispirillales bacterium]|jgi:hypothetical protein|nr:hypothetical protein [Chitinispirillales bacterium]